MPPGVVLLCTTQSYLVSFCSQALCCLRSKTWKVMHIILLTAARWPSREASMFHMESESVWVG